MRQLTFLDSYSIDHGEVDEQHKRLFDLINEVARAIDSRELALCREVSAGFIAAAQEHFASEEQFLERIGFPRLDRHHHYHQQLIAIAEEARDVCCGDDSSIDIEACFDRLLNFFIDDVVRGDLEFKSWLQHKGLIPRR
jgi:hemerythrin-like metal-binding protein